MAKLTIGFGAVLLALAVWRMVSPGGSHLIAPAEAGFGLTLMILGKLAATENREQRKRWMKRGAVVGILAFVVAEIAAMRGFAIAHRAPLADTAAIASRYQARGQSVIAAVCLLFVAMSGGSLLLRRRSESIE